MNYTFNLSSVYKSLIKEIQEIIKEVHERGISTNLTYHAWESRGAVTELPDADLLGLINWSYSENEGLPVIEAGMILSTINDINLFKEVEILDAIRDHCWDGESYKTWGLFDNESGLEYGRLQLTEFEILPSGRSEVRSTRHIGMEFIKTANVN